MKQQRQRIKKEFVGLVITDVNCMQKIPKHNVAASILD